MYHRSNSEMLLKRVPRFTFSSQGLADERACITSMLCAPFSAEQKGRALAAYTLGPVVLKGLLHIARVYQSLGRVFGFHITVGAMTMLSN